MNKKLFVSSLVCLLSLIIFTGCGGKDEFEDTHYKPSEYKHDVAISKAKGALEEVERNMLILGYDSPVDKVINTYNDSLKTLTENLNNLEETRNNLNDDDLSRKELDSWNSQYDTMISAVKRDIKDIEQKKEDFLK